MSVTLRQIRASQQSLDMHALLPDRLHAMTPAEISQIPLQCGNRRCLLSDFFIFEQTNDGETGLTLLPAGSNLDFVGAQLESGRILVRGDVGDYAGQAMLDGQLTIEGSAGSSLGCGLRGGTIRVFGDAGDRVGAPPSGARLGQQGGVIHIRGNAGMRAGERQRRGMLIIDGDAGELLGHRMIAGTIHVGGSVGGHAGYGMTRGSIVLRQMPAELPRTLCRNGRQHLQFLHLLSRDLNQLSDGTVAVIEPGTPAERFLGDLACNGRGEILVVA